MWTVTPLDVELERPRRSPTVFLAIGPSMPVGTRSGVSPGSNKISRAVHTSTAALSSLAEVSCSTDTFEEVALTDNSVAPPGWQTFPVEGPADSQAPWLLSGPGAGPASRFPEASSVLMILRSTC